MNSQIEHVQTADLDRRRFRFRSPKFLIGCAVFLLLVIVGLTVWRLTDRELHRHRQAAQVAREIERLGGSVSWNPELLETIVRDRAFTRITDVHISDPTFPDEGLLILKQLPQHFGLQIRGPQFSDASLGYLKQVPNLKYLVLKQTRATDEGLKWLKKSMPDLEIMHGYPGDRGYRVVK